jgi:hypothetical protein
MTMTYRSEYTDRLWAERVGKGDEARYTDSFAEEYAAGAVQYAREILVRALETRLCEITSKQRERIESCCDLRQLDDWITKLLSRTAADILGD